MVCMSEPASTKHERIPEWTIGWRLKRALDFADLSAQEMATELGVHVGTVSRWMNDRETPRRAVPLHPELAAELAAEHARRETGRRGSGFRYANGAADGWLFPGRSGGHATPNAIGKAAAK